jgi:hypothetical protein
MPRLQELLDHCLTDRRITPCEVETIRGFIERDGRLDLEDVKFLVRLLSESSEVCEAFDDLFFPVLKEVVLRDGRIGADEQFYLLKMLYSDGHIRMREKQFLRELQREASEVPPEFEALCEHAFDAASKDWDVGGTPAGAGGRRR